MPRQARIDAPGALHHIICRGIERRRIFLDDPDRDDFVSRLGAILLKTSTRCFAWVLLPNHFHLLLQTGTVPIATVMRRLLTGYAVAFNLRHKRSGHLFQNRYKPILCQAEPYFLELVRYIHLNPLRAGLVTSMSSLAMYRYSGHSRIILDEAEPWLEIDQVISRFGNDRGRAVPAYEFYEEEGAKAGHRYEFTGGGLVRSAGGWRALLASRRAGMWQKSDERILGDNDFVEEVLANAEEAMERKNANLEDGLDLQHLAKRAAELLLVKPEKVMLNFKKPGLVGARSLVCHWAIRDLGMSATTIAAAMGLSVSAVSRLAQRGELLAAENKWDLR